jgi:GTPase SAR1 family protein
MELVSWNRSKIMLVGQGRAGKTALARSMIGEPFKETPSTIGGELFEREIREGSVKGGKLAEHKRPEKELEWMIAKNGMKYQKQKQHVMKAKQETTQSSNEKNNSKLASSSEKNTLKEHRLDEQDEHPLDNDNSTRNDKKEKERKIKTKDINREALYKLITENVNTGNNLSKLTISLCDFGGQDVFNALHAFFMTRCGVYMLVFDMELFLSKNEKDRESCHQNIKFWMNSIAMHTYNEKTEKTAPVALVGTRKDRVSSVEGRVKISRELQERYENHRIWPSVVQYNWEGEKRFFRSWEGKVLSYFPIDNTKRRRESTALTKLLGETEERMMESEEVKIKIPVIWMKALDEMREKGKKENKSFLLLEEVTEIVENLGISLEGMSELLRYLYEMGVLIWIEEPGLREVVILDPIEYFVKPVTRIICKHLASKKDPYAIKHELPIHKECQREISEDWKLMLEFGLVSDRLARRLLKNKANVEGDSIEKLLLLMKRYGLMIPIRFEGEATSHGAVDIAHTCEGSVFFVPSLVPDEPDSIILSDRSTGEKDLIARLKQRFTFMLQFRSSATVFLSFSLPVRSGNDFLLFSYNRIEKNGFLPNGLFDRFIARILSNLPDLVVKSNDTRFIAFKDMMRIDCNGKLIRFTNQFHQNMIKIEIEEGNSVTDLRKLVEEWLEVVKKLIRECYKCLEVTVLLPVDCEEGKNGLISLEGLLNKQQSVMPEYISEDGLCKLTKSKFIELLSKWCPAVAIVPLPVPPFVNPTKPSHIMFSYAWGCNKDHVIAMEGKLRAKGYDIWRDENGSSIVPAMGVGGSTFESMARAVENSSWVIIFVSKNYFNSENCKNEAEYCCQKHKPLLFVMLDENYHTSSSPETVESWLGLMIGTKLWYPLWDLDQLESGSAAIAKKIGNISLLSQNQQLLVTNFPPLSTSLP